MDKPCHYYEGFYKPEPPETCLEGALNADECIMLERGICWMDCEYGGEYKEESGNEID